MPVPTQRKQCLEEGCKKSFLDHEWGAKDAYKQGWFVTKDGRAWCGDHNPDWVIAWREKQKSKKKPSELSQNSTLADVQKALSAAIEKNPYLLKAHASYTANSDGSITIHINPKLKDDDG